MNIKRALISVSSKEGITELAQALVSKNVEIISTGGTKKHLEAAGIKVISAESVTNLPEAFGGRMKTLSFHLMSALLYRRNEKQDQAEAKKLGIDPIDLVVCNLYPFEEKVKEKVDDDTLVENIDIGGPTMLRAAAKNFKFVNVLIDPAQYCEFIERLNNDENTLEYRKNLALNVYQRTASYDQAIALELGERWTNNNEESPFNFYQFEHKKELRYGENPHQKAHIFYEDIDPSEKEYKLAHAKILQGKALSYNNYLDADTAWKATSELFHLASDKGTEQVACAIVKHSNPCGLALASDNLKALELAWAGDPVSSFGSIISFSHKIDKDIALWLEKRFVEVIIAPEMTEAAREIFAKKKNLRLLLTRAKKQNENELMVRSINGALLVQDEDELLEQEYQVVTKTEFPKTIMNCFEFGIISAKYLKSNAISIVTQDDSCNFYQVSAGMGQPNRIDSLCKLATLRAGDNNQSLENGLLVSDAFFPFADNIEKAAEAGIRFVIQPGGSIKDSEVIEACDKLDIAMAFTGRRHFRH